ncbi:hypothetical protein CC78DRAFT_611486 [Lojkania enalia]|uniref:Uncharacterized protein n=1 Tax=Lojkania enalia TaxID=147567 RepID=A0A9P4NCN8_9PLEO|nr:hypothetical protein CC78DRAFT_611486 [Didymosphaeria enalia]
MAIRIDDHWLWLSLGVFAVIATKGVSLGLRHIVHLTEVHTAPPKPTIPPPQKGKEDAIKTEALGVLASSDNVEIRKAATKILCDRFFADRQLREKLARDVNSQDPDVRHRSRLACRLLLDNGVMHEVPSTPMAHRARPELGNRRLTWMNRRAVARGIETNNSEERDLRRRRREAIVINEGDRPVSQEDVYMRDSGGQINSEEVAEGLQRLAEVVSEIQGVLEGSSGEPAGRARRLEDEEIVELIFES